MKIKNKTIVRIFTIAMLFVIIASSASIVFAEEAASGYTDPDKYGGAVSTTGGNVQTTANQIIGIVQIVGMAVAVIMLIWLGVKYVSAAPSEKADIKKGALVYVVGAVLILASTAILQLIKTFGTEAANGVSTD